MKDSHKVRTSWHKVGSWYNKLVGERGQYYHEHVILPGVLRLLNLKSTSSLLDLGCGQGILARVIPKEVRYVGIDVAPSLISFAKERDRSDNHEYIVADITNPLPVSGQFSHAAMILSLQNVEFPALAIEKAASHLVPDGKLLIVLNHPAFRIPRQSSWEIDPKNKLQYRRINRYMSSLKIPVVMHPGEGKGSITWSFHEPISSYAKIISDNHFVIEKLEEWTSDKESVGKAAKMENRSRSEFPLFLAILARKEV